LEKCLGGAACLAALAAGVSAGLMLRASDVSAALPERRAEVASLSPAEKDQLRRQYTRFGALSPEQQDHLREFDGQLAEAQDAEALRGTLRRYHEWLRTISASERGELLKLANDPVRKADRVEELSPLSREDAAAIEKWLKDCARARGHLWEEAQLFWGQTLLGDRAFGDGRAGPGPAKKIPGGGARLSESEVKALSASLSGRRQAQLAQESSTRGKCRLVLAWWQRRGGAAAPPQGPTSTDELVRFFTDDLKEETRRKLLAMPADQMRRELREEYRKAKSGDGGRRPRN
jgi:hypothetical protein